MDKDYIRGQNNNPFEYGGPKSLDDLLSQDFPPTEWIVDDLIPEQAIVLLSAHPASFKTWWALDLSLKVAAGESFLNHFETNQTGVLIMDAESGDRQLQKHFKILGARNELPVFYKTCNRKRIDKNFANSILVVCAMHNIKLVIFDSLTRFHNANENDAREMSEIFESFTTLKNNGITSLIICHSRKTNFESGGYNRRNQAESIRGSSDILAACDLHLIMNRGDDNVVKICQTKNRFDEEMRPFSVRFVKDSPICSHWEFKEILDTKEDRFHQAKENIYAYVLNNPGLNQKQLVDAVRRDVQELKSGKIKKALDELVAEKRVYVKSGDRTTKLYYILDGQEDGELQNV